jgi:two-component system chemotaxis response regulator CheB
MGTPPTVCTRGSRGGGGALSPTPVGERRDQRPVDVVLVAASTGGPDALHTLLSTLPEPLPVPILAVQHLPAAFVPALAARLDASSPTRVRVARHGEVPVPGTVHLAAGDHHLEVGRRDGRITMRLRNGPPVRSFRPSADVLFRSAAAAYGPGTVAVVLTGMGGDGLEGCRDLARAGATVLAQDEATSVVWGMPGAITRAGLATATLPLGALGHTIADLLKTGAFGPKALR